MSQAPSVAFAGSTDDHHVEPANVSLKGTTRGLEILIAGTPSAGALGARLTELLAEAPGFFAGSNARVAIDGVLPIGALACLEDVATRFELRIVEIGPVAARRPRDLAPVPHAASPLSPPTATPLPPMPPIPPLPAALPAGTDDVPLAKLAEGTGPIAEDAEINPSGRVRLSGDAGASDQVSSPALVSAATALVNAALAMTSEPSGAALAPWTPADSPTGAAARIALTESSTGATANAALTHSSNGAAANAALTDSSIIDAAAKAASTDSSTGTTTTAAPTDAPSDAACKAAPVATREPGSASDPGLLAALAAVLVAAGGGDAAAAPADESPPGPRLVFGPLRSGRIVDHVGHLIVIGDVNPGAEVRAEGSIIVLGRLRGVAHAAIGRDAGCIIALSLQPQQLRIGRMVARAGDADRPGGGAEIAYATGETIVVERFSGRLPSGLAASM